MNSIQKKRCLRFANFLEKRVNEKNFDIGCFCRSQSFNPENIVKELSSDLSCGTVACAFGHLPVFNGRVFKYFRYNFDNNSALYRVGMNGNLHYNSVSKKMCDIMFKYFGLTSNYVDWIFYQSGYNKSVVKPSDVARRIRGIATKDEKVLKEYSRYYSM